MLSHHVCDEHEWEGGGCDFCNVTVGSVLSQEVRNQTQIEMSVSCKIELHNRSKQAERVISTELGRGHTSLLTVPYKA